jgi:hypothetical protein
VLSNPCKSSSPPGANYFWNAQGEGSLGPLDLFVDASTGSTDRGFWHTQVLAVGTLSVVLTPIPEARRAQTGTTEVINMHKVSFRLIDAGDPLGGAKIVASFGGKDHPLTTSKGGYASFVVHGPGKLIASATTPGYRGESMRRRFLDTDQSRRPSRAGPVAPAQSRRPRPMRRSRPSRQ